MGGEEPLDITWKPFSLAQINQKIGVDFEVWSVPDEELDPSLWALRAGEAARQQGEDAMRAFIPFLLRARHEDRIELSDRQAILRSVELAGLDQKRFVQDLEDRSSLESVAASHRNAVSELGVFGTPTFVFPNGAAAFLKLIKPQSPTAALKAFQSLAALMEGDVFVGEVKRPQPPWPKGIFD